MWIAAFIPQYFHLCFCDKFSTQISKFEWIKLSFFLFPVFHLSLYLGLPTYPETHLQLSPEIFFLSQIYSCLSPWVFFFLHVNFLFPLVAFKGSLQRIYTLAKIAVEFMLTVFPLPATDKRQEGVEPEIRDALGRRLLICLLSPGETSVNSLWFSLVHPKGCWIMDTL